MAYQLTPTTKAPILTGTGGQIHEGTSNVTIGDTSIVALGALDTVLYLVGLALGTTDVTITPNGGSPVTHAVTVTADPFDWTLGAPVAK